VGTRGWAGPCCPPVAHPEASALTAREHYPPESRRRASLRREGVKSSRVESSRVESSRVESKSSSSREKSSQAKSSQVKVKSRQAKRASVSYIAPVSLWPAHESRSPAHVSSTCRPARLPSIRLPIATHARNAPLLPWSTRLSGATGRLACMVCQPEACTRWTRAMEADAQQKRTKSLSAAMQARRAGMGKRDGWHVAGQAKARPRRGRGEAEVSSGPVAVWERVASWWCGPLLAR